MQEYHITHYNEKIGSDFMAQIKVNQEMHTISLMVFDKDGLMFKSQAFWIELGNERIRQLKKHLGNDAVKEWARFFGLTLENGLVTYADPKGTLAVASPAEEIAVTAGILARYIPTNWAKALEIARGVFINADHDLDLNKAIVPQKGFPRIFERLRQAGIPYAVATSDTKERLESSLALVGETAPEMVVVPNMVAKGKPAPDMLNLISKLSNIPAQEIAMVGDSYVDVKMAQAAGSLGIGVPETEEMRTQMQEYTSAIVNSLDDIEIV